MHVHVEFGFIIVHRWHGRVADYCAICRDLTPCRMLKRKKVATANFIPYGLGEVEGYENECENCKMRWRTEPYRFDRVSNSRRATLAELVEQTHSRPGQYIISLLALAERIRNGALSDSERRQALLDPLNQLESELGRYYWRRLKEQRLHASGCLSILTVISATTAMILATIVSMSIVLAATVLTVGLLLLGIYFHRTHTQRYVRRELEPKLVRALKPLKPSEHELSELMAQHSNYQLVRHLSVGRLIQAISS
jgi:hypothetical protein